jgi:hypothetical protein
MIFVLALVGAFLPQTQSAIFKKYAVLPPARDEKTFGFLPATQGRLCRFFGTSSRKGMGNCNPHQGCRCVNNPKWIIGSHGETCSLLLSIFLSQQNTKNYPSNDLNADRYSDFSLSEICKHSVNNRVLPEKLGRFLPPL